MYICWCLGYIVANEVEFFYADCMAWQIVESIERRCRCKADGKSL